MSLKITDYTPKFEYQSTSYTRLTVNQLFKFVDDLESAVDAGLDADAEIVVKDLGGGWAALTAQSGFESTGRVSEPEDVIATTTFNPSAISAALTEAATFGRAR